MEPAEERRGVILLLTKAPPPPPAGPCLNFLKSLQITTSSSSPLLISCWLESNTDSHWADAVLLSLRGKAQLSLLSLFFLSMYIYSGFRYISPTNSAIRSMVNIFIIYWQFQADIKLEVVVKYTNFDFFPEIFLKSVVTVWPSREGARVHSWLSVVWGWLKMKWTLIVNSDVLLSNKCQINFQLNACLEDLIFFYQIFILSNLLVIFTIWHSGFSRWVTCLTWGSQGGTSTTSALICYINNIGMAWIILKTFITSVTLEKFQGKFFCFKFTSYTISLIIK